jgi:hypothetical protein
MKQPQTGGCFHKFDTKNNAIYYIMLCAKDFDWDFSDLEQY